MRRLSTFLDIHTGLWGFLLYNMGMEGLSNYEKEVRPWGNFERFTLNEQSTVKIITVNPGEAFSLQVHGHREEFWRGVSYTTPSPEKPIL